MSWGHVTFCNLDLSSSVSTACSLLCPLLWWMTNEYLNLCSLFPVSFMLPLILLCLSCLVWWHCLVQEYTGKNIVRTHNWNHIQVMICLENFKVLDSVFLYILGLCRTIHSFWFPIFWIYLLFLTPHQTYKIPISFFTVL